MKRQATYWEKVFGNCISDQGLVSTIHKELYQCNIKRKIKQSNQKVDREMDKCFTEENIVMVNKFTKRCSTSFAIRNMQIKTTMGHHYTPIKTDKIKVSNNAKCWRRGKETG